MVEMEKSLIGTMIIDNSKIPDVISNIRESDFEDYNCRIIYKKIIDMFDKNEEINIVTLGESLKNTKITFDVLNQFIEIVPTSELCYNYMKKVKENSSKKELLSLFNKMQKKLQNNDFEDIEKFKANCIDKLNIKTGVESILDTPVIDYTKQWLKEIKELRKIPIISTGFPGLNKKLGGGIFAGLYVVGAISALGKTAFVLQMADQIAKNNHPVLYISTEMAKHELVARSISRNMFNIDRERFKDVGTRKILRGNFHDFIGEMNQALVNYEATAKNLTIQKCNFNTDIAHIKSIVKAFIHQRNSKPVVVIDYLQTIKAEGFNERQKIDNVVSGLKDISTDFNIPVIAISSFNRANYFSKVSFENFKESGLIEYTSDVLIGLQLSVLDELELTEKNKHKNKELITRANDEMPRRITAVVLKQRNAKAWVKQNFLFFPKNNYIQEE